MITVTDSAKTQIITLMNEEGHDPETTWVRVTVKGGGCSGLMYDMTFNDDDIWKHEPKFNSNGINIVTTNSSLVYILDTELDWSGGLNGKGFIFNNPNATRSCACGDSFSV